MALRRMSKNVISRGEKADSGSRRIPTCKVRSRVVKRLSSLSFLLCSLLTSLPPCEAPSLPPSLTFPKHRRLIRSCSHSLIHSFLHIRAAGLSLLEDPSQPVRSHQFATRRDFTKQPSPSLLHTIKFTSERKQLHRTSKHGLVPPFVTRTTGQIQIAHVIVNQFSVTYT